MSELITVELEFVKDAPTYVEGKDAKGFSRAFEKSTHEYRIVRDRLFVDVDKRLWERRMARTPLVKPVKAKAKQKVKRKCMLCKHEFVDQPQIRICGHCKKTANWQSGGEYGLYS
jgi:hypothetical protein